MGIIGLIVIGIYVYLGDKANYYLKYHLLNVRAELYGDTFNYLLKRAVAGAFLGWATIPVAIIHYLLTSKTSSSRNTDMDALSEIDNNMNSAPRKKENHQPSFISKLIRELRAPSFDDLDREAQQIAFIARDGDGYIQSLIQVIGYVDLGMAEDGGVVGTKGELISSLWGNTNRTQNLEEAHWERVTTDWQYWCKKAKGLGVEMEGNKILEIGMRGFRGVVEQRYLKSVIEQLPHLKRVADLQSGLIYRYNPHEYIDKFDKSGWTVEVIPSQIMRVNPNDEYSDRWVVKAWEERGREA